jgi:hypothetical protein
MAAFGNIKTVVFRKFSIFFVTTRALKGILRFFVVDITNSLKEKNGSNIAFILILVYRPTENIASLK